MRFDPEIAHWLCCIAAAGLSYTQVYSVSHKSLQDTCIKKKSSNTRKIVYLIKTLLEIWSLVTQDMMESKRPFSSSCAAILSLAWELHNATRSLFQKG